MTRCVVCGAEIEDTEAAGWFIKPRAVGDGIFALCPKHYHKSPTAAYIASDDLIEDQYYALEREHKRTGRINA